ncbi:MAG TPA: flavin reductase family protein [Gemmatimonadaceae bacterium]|jgi:flavin reductase (DIM6/NTAB) family NADH-FMN oxidoreductase RutF
MIDSDGFRAALGRFSCGITIVTACDSKGRDHGMTVSAFCSVSLDPSLVLVCIGHDASMHGLMMRVEHIAISVLSSAQEALSRRFADPETDRFDGVGYTRGENGVALLDDALVHLECKVIARHEAGDHTIVVCSVDRAEAFDARPLLYYRGGYAQLER